MGIHTYNLNNKLKYEFNKSLGVIVLFGKIEFNMTQNQ